MASVTITVTVTDTVNHPLATVRDKLMIRWNYEGPNTNPAKLAFIQAKLAKYLKDEYKAQLDAESYAVAIAPDTDIQ